MVLLAESNHDGRAQSPVGLFGASAQTEFSLPFEELEEMIHRFFMKRWVLSDEALPDALPIDEEVVKVIRVSPQCDFEDRQTIWWMAVHLHTRQLYGSMWIRSAQNCANVMTCIYSFALIVIDLQWYLRAGRIGTNRLGNLRGAGGRHPSIWPFCGFSRMQFQIN